MTKRTKTINVFEKMQESLDKNFIAKLLFSIDDQMQA